MKTETVLGKTSVAFHESTKEAPKFNHGPFLVRRYQIDNDQKGRKCHAEIRYIRLPNNKERQQIRIEHCVFVEGFKIPQDMQIIHMQEADLKKILAMYKVHPSG